MNKLPKTTYLASCLQKFAQIQPEAQISNKPKTLDDIAGLVQK